MSKILVLGRTMDMGGTEVAMAALLQKLVEKKEDVTLLLVEKRGVLLERIPKEVEVRQMIWTKSRIRLWNGLWENGRTVFLCQRNGRISDARRVWKETVWKTV